MGGGCNYLQSDNETEIETINHEHEGENTKVDINIKHDEDIRKRIEVVAESVRKFQSVYVETRKTVKEQLEEIVDLGINQYRMKQAHLRDLIDEVFSEQHVHPSYLRKLLPDILKNTSKGRLDYKQKRELAQQREQQLRLKEQGIKPEGDNIKGDISENSAKEVLTTTAEFETIALNEELRRAHEEIKRLQDKVQKLEEPFTARAILELRGKDVPIVATVDPLNRNISSVEIISLTF